MHYHIFCVFAFLKQLSQTKLKEELEEEFDVIWIVFMEKVPKFECISLHQIEAEVETALLKHVGPQGGYTKHGHVATDASYGL